MFPQFVSPDYFRDYPNSPGCNDDLFHPLDNALTQHKDTTVPKQKKDFDFDHLSEPLPFPGLSPQSTQIDKVNFDSLSFDSPRDPHISLIREQIEKDDPRSTTSEGILNQTDSSEESLWEQEDSQNQNHMQMEEEPAPQPEESKQVSFQVNNPATTQHQLKEIGEVKMLITASKNYSANIPENDSMAFKVIVEPSPDIIGEIEPYRKESHSNNGAKNFAKTFGNKFLVYLKTKLKSNVDDKLFRDNTSWKKLTAYCTGSETIPGVDQGAFITMLFEFIKDPNTEATFGKGGTFQANLLCQMTSFMSLKLAIQEIENSGRQCRSINFGSIRGYKKMILKCESNQ